ncbi:MAG: ABC-2 family transporter protein [archaeon]|jgi:ABC-2 type transport system permease protein|nr:ABC-2 family transporter protein [archaeon]
MLKKIGRFIGILWKGLALSAGEEMAYKASFILLSLSLIFGDLIGPMISYAVYKISAGIPGWTLLELILLQATSIFVFGVWHAFLGGISWVTSDYIAEGEMDTALLKPFSTIGYLMSKGMDFHGIMDVITGLALIIFVIVKLELFGVMLLPFVFLILLALIFMFSVALLLAALSMIFVRVWALGNIIDILGMVSSYPASIYSQGFKLAVTFVIPAAIASYWPAAVLLGKEPLSNLGFMILPVLVFLLFSLWFWGFALKRHQSAGG